MSDAAIQIEPCIPGVIAECAALMAAVYAEPPYLERWSPDEALVYLQRFLGFDAGSCFVARANGDLAGAVFAYAYPYRSQRMLYIQELFVARTERRQGVASALLERLAESGTTRAWLVAREGTAAFRFYTELGLSAQGPYRLLSGPLAAG